MSTPVCIANAVCDALGVENVTLPLMPAKIAALFHKEEPPPPEGKAAPEAKAGGHILTGAGATLVPAAPEEVWRTLLDPEKLAAVIPGCHSLDAVGQDSYRAEVTVGAGPVKGLFQANVALSELDPPRSANLAGGLAGPLGSSQGTGQVKLEAADGGTRVTYSYRIEVTGTVAAVGGRLLDGATRALMRQFFERLTAQVGGKAAPAQSWWGRLLSMLGLKK